VSTSHGQQIRWTLVELLPRTPDDPRWEPKRLRLRLFSIAGRLARHARRTRTRLRLATHAPWADLLVTALARLQPD
jgi:Transposase DDE domain group 1